MNSAQGPELVFDVLPRAFAEMPGGRLVGTLFFILLVLAALMPSVALLEPAVAWLIQRAGLGRTSAVCVIAVAAWVLGLGSVLSYSWWSGWHPLAAIPSFADKTFFDVIDYMSANIMMPIGAVLTSILVAWRLNIAFTVDEFSETRLSPESRAAGSLGMSVRLRYWRFLPRH
jgi:NSS family neurotransmitter:Na+ symporter